MPDRKFTPTGDKPFENGMNSLRFFVSLFYVSGQKLILRLKITLEANLDSPCGRPLLIGRGEERVLSTLTRNDRWERNNAATRTTRYTNSLPERRRNLLSIPPARIPRPSLRDKRKSRPVRVDILEDSFQENITPYDDDHIDKVDRTAHIRAGSPRGSLLSPILYNIYTYDFPTSLVEICLFADDAAIPKPTRHPAEKTSTASNSTEQSTAPHLKRPHLHQMDPSQRPKNPALTSRIKLATAFYEQVTPTPTASSISKLPWTLRELTTCLSKQLT
ncbi:hypothetical protein TNCV_4256631 [Trichonephila clavipes]|nr:hypothetical protein TNCV_4256631 [Trichonephila clavipes]